MKRVVYLKLIVWIAAICGATTLTALALIKACGKIIDEFVRTRTWWIWNSEHQLTGATVAEICLIDLESIFLWVSER